MKSITYNHMIAFLVTHQLIPCEQHGFLPGRSVQSNLLCCMSDWTKDVASERPLDIVYLDFSKTFDRVPKGRLLHESDHLELRDNLYWWIDSFLSDRTFRVKIGNAVSRSIDARSEVPQGSVLGPLLFIAYTTDIKNIITSSFVIFADDIKLYNSCDNFSSLSSDLHSIYKWSQVTIEYFAKRYIVIVSSVVSFKTKYDKHCSKT